MFPLPQYEAIQVPRQVQQCPVCLVIHEGRIRRPLGYAANQLHPLPSQSREVTWAGFVLELDKMFVDPNHQATAWRKLATLHQGDSSVEELIQEFEIHGPISGLGNIGLVDWFEQVIHPHLQESIYWLKPMPTTWAEWKCKTSLLDNQWRRFQDTQPKAATTKLSLFCSPPVFSFTPPSPSSFSQPSAPPPHPPPPPHLPAL